MVVNRKQPTAPAPPVSRSSSSQSVPPKRQPKTSNPVATSSGNGTDIQKASTPAKAKPPKTKQKKHVKRRSKSYFDRLFVLSLSLFTFYAFYTCRPNPLFHSRPTHPEPVLCKSLSTYRTVFLEPYVLPPLKHTLEYTQPYIALTHEHLAPYLAPVQNAISTSKPYIYRLVSTAQGIWHGTLVPLYTNTLKPYFDTAVVPRYRRYIHPRLVPLQKQASAYFAYYVTNPLHKQYTALSTAAQKFYALHFQSYVHQVKPHVKKFGHHVHRFALASVDVYETKVYPRLVDAWIRARPVLCAAWKQTKVVVLHAADVAAALVKKVAREVGIARRAYVDPHIRKMWEKVAEGNASEVITSAPFVAQDLPDTQETVESVVEPTASSSVHKGTTTPIPTTPECAAENTHLADPEVPSPAEETVVGVVKKTKAGAVPVLPPVEELEGKKVEKEEAQAALSIAEASAHHASAAVSVIESEVEESLHVHVSQPTTAEIEPAHTDAPAPVPVPQAEVVAESVTPAAPVPSGVGVGVGATETQTEDVDADVDLDDFLRDIGVDNAASSPSESPELFINQQQPVPPAQEPTPESEADRLARVAAKREDITTRHEAWSGRLHESIEKAGPALAQAIEGIRKRAVAEVEAMKGAKGKDDEGVVGDVQKEGGRLVKGLEGYLRKAEARSVDWKAKTGGDDDGKEKEKEVQTKEMRAAMANKEKDKWRTVLSKVEEKFAERVRALQGEVHAWYVGVREKEGEEVMNAAADIKRLAEKAQADIGLDYAWLDDVTYNDWQKYHDLMRASEKFEHTAYAIQNGTSSDPPAPSDPLVPALDALHNDLQDVVLGFQVALAPVRSRAAKAFSLSPVGADDEDDESSGFFVVKDGERRRDDFRGVDLGGITKAEGAGVLPVKGGEEGKGKDEVRILPIEVGEEQKGTFDASKVIIGKDKVQVEQALKDVPLEPVVRHEEL